MRSRLCGFIRPGLLALELPGVTVSEAQPVPFRCFDAAFRAAGRAPAAILIDNVKSEMLDNGRDEIVFQPAFLAFAENSGFEPIAAQPGRAQTSARARPE